MAGTSSRESLEGIRRAVSAPSAAPTILKFGAELEVNAAGLVTRYPNFWKAETGD